MDDLDLPPGIDLPTSRSRCWPANDTECTCGDVRGGAWICISWAKGACRLGKTCEALHRLPSLAEEQRMVYSTDGLDSDVFGRPLAGSAQRDGPLNSTLAVHGLPSDASQRELRTLLDAFNEWGTVLRTWVGAVHGTGFVKFKWRSSAQFALEAMDGQPISPEGGTPLMVRWATVNPEVEAAKAGHVLALRSMQDAKKRRDTQHELYQRLEREAKALKQHAADVPGQTTGCSVDHQAHAAVTCQTDTIFQRSLFTETLTNVTACYPGTTASVRANHEHDANIGAAEADEPALPLGWVRAVDEHAGYYYYYHKDTQRTQWEHPGDGL
mmetsp:Transcript_40274/g.66878  ORF Transcript_40274/g.66878 Transcript_40274/m.66878 type:complete len:326 (-) Transcript_40274:118-1095(-)|eukprot:CAMPEP_0119310662 /NCGR_PEP_ID=MMETSP1333-20130426/19696_1 /TAXON_ID=418940 /ORGANISM="Scyphosphaera apsteinii, Strain RCC1455" /LENGTH=325 /DNA_ID=CAMNT_0007314881 /DNA_START=53 /DNA_END=1030 /DNA_ORIENTATION=-